LLFQLVKLSNKLGSSVGELHDEPNIDLDSTVLAVLLNRFRVLADIFEIQHGNSL
jgi:hypothetical protein